jgi:hypothetical protein
MISRALIHVAGPASAGKTALIEAILARSGALVIAARCVREDSAGQLRESTPAADPELRRYREAGAIAAAVLSFPGDADLSEDFFSTDLMMNYSEAVVLEGDSPLRFVDLRVFVAPAPAEGKQLFVRRTHAQVPDARASTAVVEQLSHQPDGVEDVLAAVGGTRLAELARQHPKVLEEMRTSLRGVAQTRTASRSRERWAIADPYAGIEHAQLVVVNARDARQRQAADQLVADVLRLRKDPNLLADILGPRGSRIPITALAANLGDPDDPARKKALARVRRAIRSASS